MNWKKAIKLEHNKFEISGDWLKLEYFEALNILFRIENSLRVFVYIVLKDEFREKWKDLSITSDDEESSTINAIARKRITQDQNYAYLGYTLTSPLLHLTSGELIRIITSEKYWKHFKSYFPGTKDIIKNKLDEIGNVRNSVAHFRPIKEGDVELIKQNAVHTLSKIEETLIDLINCPDIVPSNSEDDWYKELIVLGIDECKLTFKQSKNEKWIKLILTVYSPILKHANSESFGRITTLNLRTDSLLKNYNELTNHTLAVTERVKSYYGNSLDTPVIKEILFTFSKDSISQNYKSIKTQIESVLLHISKEIALIKDDNLARGKLVETVECRFEKQKRDTMMYLYVNSLKTKLGEDTPVEFWGTLNYSTDNFIVDTENYPWMPVPVSEGDLPF